MHSTQPSQVKNKDFLYKSLIGIAFGNLSQRQHIMIKNRAVNTQEPPFEEQSRCFE